jgi:ribosomal protein L30
MPRLKVTQIRSKVGNKPEQRDTLRSLGLKRINDVVVKEMLKTEPPKANTSANRQT